MEPLRVVDERPASPLETLATTPAPEKRGRGRPPGSGTKKPVAFDAPAVPPPEPAAAEDEDELEIDTLTADEATDLIASAVDFAFTLTGLKPPLTKAEITPIRPHALPVVKRWANVILKKYIHEILLVTALWGPIKERSEAAKRAKAQPPQNYTPPTTPEGQT
ncbi:MAG: hypothetical protein ACYCXG_11800 [Acidiferrobacter sp.]